MEGRGAAGAESIAASNRRFGALLEMADVLPKAVIALIEGAAMGGGVGLIAVADWVIAEKAAQIGTPEATVGIVPAQIAPFVVRRIGYAQARRLAAFGLRFSAGEAQRIGLVHELADGRDELMAKGVAAVNQCLRCAPDAVAETKRLVRASLTEPLGRALDEAAHMFAASLAGEAREGIRAFVEKRKATWAEKIEKL
jgi:isohexenylglutaconyl-CoA hydratase